MSNVQRPHKDPAAQAQMEQLVRDLDNIALMNEQGKKDSREAKKENEEALKRQKNHE